MALFKHRKPPTEPAPRPEAKSSTLRELIALSGAGSASWSSRDASALAIAGYRRNSVGYRSVQMIIEAASSIPLYLCDRRGPITDHEICTLLQRPNPDETAQNFLERIYGHLQIYGNAYIEIVGDARKPLALYLLRPDLTEVVHDTDGWPDAYTYIQRRGKRRIGRRPDGTLPVVHIRLFNPLDDHAGQSPMQVAGNAIDIHNAALAWNKSLLDNAARPSGALVYRGVDGASHLTADQFDRLKSELGDAYQGALNAGRPLVLDGGLDWKPMSMSPAEMDFHELKNSAARDIALAFGIPPMLLGIPGDNTYANYQQAVLSFWRQTVVPLAGKVAHALSSAMAPTGTSIALDLDAVNALDETRAQRLRMLLSADVLTAAEKRVALGYAAEPESGLS